MIKIECIFKKDGKFKALPEFNEDLLSIDDEFVPYRKWDGTPGKEIK